MASLKALQKKVPGAATVAGRVIAYVGGKHYDLGSYHGDDTVALSADGMRLMHPPVEEVVSPPPGKKPAGKPVSRAPVLEGLEDLEL